MVTGTSPRAHSARLLLFTLAALLGLALAAVLLHEAAHAGAALVLGVDDIKFGFYGFNPAVFMPPGTPTGILKIIHYAGGLGSGAAGIAAYVVWRRVYRRAPTARAWLLGVALAVVTGWQIANGVVEGRMHSAYILWSGDLFTLTNLLMGMGMMEGMLIHRWLNPPLRKVTTRER